MGPGVPFVLGSAASPFEATHQPSSRPPKAEDLRPNPLAGTHNGPFHVCVDGAPPLSEARKVRPVTLAEFSDVPRLYEAMGEAEQVLKLSN